MTFTFCAWNTSTGPGFSGGIELENIIPKPWHLCVPGTTSLFSEGRESWCLSCRVRVNPYSEEMNENHRVNLKKFQENVSSLSSCKLHLTYIAEEYLQYNIFTSTGMRNIPGSVWCFFTFPWVTPGQQNLRCVKSATEMFWTGKGWSNELF